VWDAWVAKASPPARATVEARLATADHLVEIMVEAAAPHGGERDGQIEMPLGQ
jgi:enamine deaminase RidA (YjgF/YER057c/UK114 family)